LTSESIADSQPLAELIAKYVDEKMLGDIAAGHRKGRRLFASTTQLDSQRLVVWDLGPSPPAATPRPWPSLERSSWRRRR
jgi:hypothetical protein